MEEPPDGEHVVASDGVGGHEGRRGGPTALGTEVDVTRTVVCP